MENFSHRDADLKQILRTWSQDNNGKFMICGTPRYYNKYFKCMLAKPAVL